MTRWEVVRQTSSSVHTVSTHRYRTVADLHRWWQDRLQQRRSRRSVEAGIREIGVYYNVLPPPEPVAEPQTETDQPEAVEA